MQWINGNVGRGLYKENIFSEGLVFSNFAKFQAGNWKFKSLKYFSKGSRLALCCIMPFDTLNDDEKLPKYWSFYTV